MKIYYICEYCEQIFSSSELEGGEGIVEVRGICDDCAMEIGMMDDHASSSYYYYN